MELKIELEKLAKCFLNLDVNKFKEQYMLLKNNFTSESEIKQIDDFIDKIGKKSEEESEQTMDEIRLRCHLILNKEIKTFNFALQDISKKINQPRP